MPHLIRLIYSSVFILLLPLLLVKMAWRNLRDTKGDRKSGGALRILERFGLTKSHSGVEEKKGGVLFHVVSVGEAIAAVDLIKRFHQRNPKTPICVTCTTPTGSNVIQAKLGDIVSHRYMPFDLPLFHDVLFCRLQPRAVFVLETEIWPNLTHACKKRQLPLILLNARLSEKSFRGYNNIRPLIRPALQSFTQILCQTEADANHFLLLGAEASKCEVIGNLKFDIALDEKLEDNIQYERKHCLNNRTCWIAASTHPGEDEMVLEAHKRLRETMPELLLVLVPRHPQRAKDIQNLCSKQGFASTLRTDGKTVEQNDAVFLVDTIGEMMVFYGASQVCFIGGSLVEHGGHNPLEPAVLSKAILSGPHVHNFKKVFVDLEKESAVIMVENSEGLADQVEKLFVHPEEANALGERAHNYLNRHRGATEKTLNILLQTLN